MAGGRAEGEPPAGKDRLSPAGEHTSDAAGRNCPCSARSIRFTLDVGGVPTPELTLRARRGFLCVCVPPAKQAGGPDTECVWVAQPQEAAHSVSACHVGLACVSRWFRTDRMSHATNVRVVRRLRRRHPTAFLRVSVSPWLASGPDTGCVWVAQPQEVVCGLASHDRLTEKHAGGRCHNEKADRNVCPTWLCGMDALPGVRTARRAVAPRCQPFSADSSVSLWLAFPLPHGRGSYCLNYDREPVAGTSLQP
ncbi:hypothetical protein Mal4_55480 [Maioricimonas rarisocia]|uniref:Uncharacterized protein n=1 Tax=Maioricimonas rarisocia TaxID=2528026 RepID=A0A517ZFA7_9PLAN|nr:hypothetical protein Mal4_55480 [Maioricimonas rarisocia]